MKKVLLFLAFFCSVHSYAQIIYEKGYFISNDGERKECLIENVDWENNPTSFNYKMHPNDKPQKNSIAEVKEFGIDHVSQYKRFTVKIERSGTNREVRFRTKNRNPEFRNEMLFLKTVVSGTANLYSYSFQSMVKYFYETDTIPVEQLIHIAFTDDKEEYVGENNQFRQQLSENLKCGALSDADFENLKFRKKSLVKIFLQYNECKGDTVPVVNFQEKDKRNVFDLRLSVGLYQAKLEMDDPNLTYNATNDFKETVYKFGFEAEYILPFNKSIWSLFVAPNHHTFESSASYSRPSSYATPPTTLNYTAKVTYSGLEIPIGLRRYFIIGKSSRIFINVLYSRNFETSGKITYTNLDNLSRGGLSSTLGRSKNFAFGFGYTYKNAGLEFRLNLPTHTTNIDVKYTTYGLQFGYKIL